MASQNNMRRFSATIDRHLPIGMLLQHGLRVVGGIAVDETEFRVMCERFLESINDRTIYEIASVVEIETGD